MTGSYNPKRYGGGWWFLETWHDTYGVGVCFRLGRLYGSFEWVFSHAD